MLTLTIEPAVNAVRLDATVPAGADHVTIIRVGPSTTEAGVRHYIDLPVNPGPLIARDFEAPIGVALTYTLTTLKAGVPGSEVDQTATITIPSQGCADTWLTDLVRPGNTRQLLIEQLPELAYSVPAAVHWVLSRRAPIVTTDIAHTPTFELSLLTDTDDEREAARAVLGNGVPVLLRTPPDEAIGNLYFSVLGFSEQRLVAPGTEPARRFVVSSVQIERPDPSLYTPLPPVTWQVVKDDFLDWADVLARRASWDALAYDYADAEVGGAGDPFPPAWLAPDV